MNVKLLTIQQACAITGKSPRQLVATIEEGQLRAVDIGMNTTGENRRHFYRILRSDLESWLSRTAKPSQGKSSIVNRQS